MVGLVEAITVGPLLLGLVLLAVGLVLLHQQAGQLLPTRAVAVEAAVIPAVLVMAVLAALAS